MNELRIALRTLRRSPAFTTVVVGTLALGIGVNTAIYSLVDGILLRPLPYEDADEVMTLWEANPQLDIPQDRVAAGTYRDWRERSSSFDALGIYSLQTFALGGVDQAVQIGAAAVSPSVFSVVGVEPSIGRGFREEEAVAGNDGVAILSSAFWAERYGSDPGVVGSALVLDDRPYTIVGVMPPAFEFPPDADDVQLWTPLTISEQAYEVRAMRVYNVVGRLSGDVPIERARSELEALSLGIGEEHPETNRGWGASVVPALEQVVGEFRILVVVLAGAAVLVLLIGCVNIASLLLARASTTRREYALRATLGAAGGRLLLTSLAETGLLAAIGGGLGVALAWLGVFVFRRVLPADVPRLDEIGVDAGVIGFALVVSGLAALLIGAYPALRALRPRLVDVLQDGGRGGSGGRASRRLLDGMVAGQVALALVLLLTAGVLLRSFAELLSVDPGFQVDEVWAVALSLPETDYQTQADQVLFWNELVDRVAALPGVEAAGGVSALPMSPLGIDFDLPISIESRGVVASADQPRAGYRAVLPGYFEALGIPLVSGRLIDRFDREEGRPVMLLNESAADFLFPREDPIGQILGMPMAGTIEVVGVVGDVRHAGLDTPPEPELFVSYQNFALRDMHLVVRASMEPGELTSALRSEIAGLGPGVPVIRVAPMRELIADSLAQSRFNMVVLLGFAGCALVLATVGIYGVVSYSVARRTGEIGIRMALGSDGPRTFWLVVGQTLGFVVAGGVVGLVGAWYAGRLVERFLFGVRPLDPLTTAAVLAILLLAGALAAGLPARRATRIDPVEALGGE